MAETVSEVTVRKKGCLSAARGLRPERKDARRATLNLAADRGPKAADLSASFR